MCVARAVCVCVCVCVEAFVEAFILFCDFLFERDRQEKEVCVWGGGVGGVGSWREIVKRQCALSCGRDGMRGRGGGKCISLKLLRDQWPLRIGLSWSAGYTTGGRVFMCWWPIEMNARLARKTDFFRQQRGFFLLFFLRSVVVVDLFFCLFCLVVPCFSTFFNDALLINNHYQYFASPQPDKGSHPEDRARPPDDGSFCRKITKERRQHCPTLQEKKKQNACG